MCHAKGDRPSEKHKGVKLKGVGGQFNRFAMEDQVSNKYLGPGTPFSNESRSIGRSQDYVRAVSTVNSIHTYIKDHQYTQLFR